MNKRKKTMTMTSNKTALLTCASLLTCGAIANLARLFWNIPLSIGSLYLPGWTGAIAFVLLGLLAAWSFREIYAFDRLVNLLYRQKIPVSPPPSASAEEPSENREVEDSPLDTHPQSHKD